MPSSAVLPKRFLMVAFELKHRVDDMLQHLRSRQASFLIYMSDEDDRRAGFLRELQDGSRALSDLHDAARRGVDAFGRYGLDGVDDHQIRRNVPDMREDLFQRRFAGDKQAVAFGVGDTVGPHLQLAAAFLARDVEHLLVGKAQDSLQHEGRLSDSRFASDQRKRSFHQPSSEHPVQLFIVHVDALFVARHDFFQVLRLRACSLDSVSHMFCHGRLFPHHFFHKRVPLSARRAFPCPFGRFVPAAGAYIYGFFFCCHRLYFALYLCKDSVFFLQG